MSSSEPARAGCKSWAAVRAVLASEVASHWRNSAYRIRAGIDVLMPGSEVHFSTTREDAILDSYGVDGGITLG